MDRTIQKGYAVRAVSSDIDEKEKLPVAALLAMAMKTLPLGTAYTVWTGIGAIGAFVIGIAVLIHQQKPF